MIEEQGPESVCLCLSMSAGGGHGELNRGCCFNSDFMCDFILVSFGQCPEATGPASAQHSCTPDAKGSAKLCDWISVLIWLFCVVNRTLKTGGRWRANESLCWCVHIGAGGGAALVLCFQS